MEDEAIDIINQYIDDQAKQREKELARQEAEKAKEVADSDDSLFPGKQAETTKNIPPPKPYIEPLKKIVIISPSELLTKNVGAQYIETQEDIENYLNTLRQQLMKAVNNNERIRIK